MCYDGCCFYERMHAMIKKIKRLISARRDVVSYLFFGGLTKAGELIMKPIRESYDRHVLSLYKGKAQFLVSGLDGSSAAVLGASALGWEI